MAAVPQRPAGRRPPPAPTDTPPELPPSLPPRPGGPGRSAPPPPTPAQRDESDEEYCEPNGGPDDVYDDCNQETDSHPAAPEEVYDDICNQPPPLPPSHHNLPPIPQSANSEPEETYDDFEEQPPPPPQPTLPQRPAPAPPQAPEETYDDISNAGPIVQHLPKKPVRDLPPPPSPVTKTSQPKEEVFDDVYEDPDTCEPQKFSNERAVSPNRGGLDSGFSQASFRPVFANKNQSPGRSVSPGRQGPLPPIPVAVSKSAGVQLPPFPGSGPSLPPMPAVISLKSRAPIPLARGAIRAKEEEEDNSPVVVPLVRHSKTNVIPPAPPPQHIKPVTPPAPPIKPPTLLAHDADEREDDSDSDEQGSHSDSPENVYEVTGETQGGQVSSQAPPPPLPGRSAPDVRPAKAAKPAGAPKPAAGGFAIDSSQILNLKNNLRKVSSDNGNTPPPTTHVTKEYAECAGSVSSFIGKFQQKAADGKPEVAQKPPVFAKKPGIDIGKSNTTTNNINISKPPSAPLPTPSRGKSLTDTAPDVTFLHKTPKNVPRSPLPSQTPPPPTPAKPQEPSEPECSEEIYDDACSGETLHSYEWFHGDIRRQDSEAKIKAFGKDGTFLVRTSKNDPKFPYTLVVYHEGRINNLRIRERTDGKYALGDEKADELAFTDVMAMVAHHKKNHVVLLGKQHAQVVLQQTPSKR